NERPSASLWSSFFCSTAIVCPTKSGKPTIFSTKCNLMKTRANSSSVLHFQSTKCSQTQSYATTILTFLFLTFHISQQQKLTFFRISIEFGYLQIQRARGSEVTKNCPTCS